MMDADTKLYGGSAVTPSLGAGEQQPIPDSDAASALYGPKKQQSQPQQPTPEIDPASALYGPEKSEAKFEPSADADGDTLYGSDEALQSTYGPAMKESLDVVYDRTGIVDPEQREQMAINAAEVFADARLPPQEASKLHALFARHVSQDPIDGATLSQWTKQSRTELRERYGGAATARLEAAQQFVRNRPELAEILRTTGLGSHPDIVRALAENAHNLRMKPKARTK